VFLGCDLDYSCHGLRFSDTGINVLATELRKSTHQHKLQPLDVLPFLVPAGANQPPKTVNTTHIYHYVNMYFRLLVLLLLCHHTEYSNMEVLIPQHCLL